jgi:hypothetical protein
VTGVYDQFFLPIIIGSYQSSQHGSAVNAPGPKNYHGTILALSPNFFGPAQTTIVKCEIMALGIWQRGGEKLIDHGLLSIDNSTISQQRIHGKHTQEVTHLGIITIK